MNPTTADVPPVPAPTAKADDEDLAARFARGEPAAFEALIERYQPRVLGLAARLLAWSDGVQDVTQEVFLAALRSHGWFRGRASLWTYLATITVNRCRSLRRRRWLEERVRRRRADEPERPAVGGERHAIRDETAAEVRAAVAALPGTYREVIVLRYLEELTVAEVADVLGVRRNTVEVRLSRARKHLAEALRHLAED